jgi:5-methylcytosine-specific restriction endonuclease McrA
MRRRGNQCIDAEAARSEWNMFRDSASGATVKAELSRMAGIRNRCFYCSDSHAADVEHFAPINRAWRDALNWRNLLWVCPMCNRKKNASFPEEEGVPLIINPAEVDPWARLILDTTTALLAPRRVEGEAEDPSGVETLKVLDVLNFEALAEGRKRSIRRLRSAASTVVESADKPCDHHVLWQEVTDDDYGVAAWFGLWEGVGEEPFSSIRSNQPRIWRHYVRAVAGRCRP